MSKINDLIASAKTFCDRYEKGRMERETVREWVLRLGSYPALQGDRTLSASERFRAYLENDASDDVRQVDIAKLTAILSG